MPDSAAENSYYARFSAARAPLRWPGGKPLALAIVVSVEHYDLYAPPGSAVPAGLPGGFGRGPYPDVRAFSMRDYGARVGFSRILRSFMRHGVKGTLAADAYTASERPLIVKQALAAGWDLVGHGMSGTHIVSSLMDEDVERSYIAQSLAPLQRLSARPLLGWHGPEYGQSARSPRMLAEAGLCYTLDWPSDDRPIAMTVPDGSMLAIPMLGDLDDVLAHWVRKISMERWLRTVMEAVEQLCAEGQASGSMLVVNIHPWLMGQPWRIGYLDRLLAWLVQRQDVQLGGTDDIAQWFSQAGA